MQRLFLSATQVNRLTRTVSRASLGVILALLIAPLAVSQQTSLFGNSTPRFLDVDEAFRLYTTLDSESQISIQWDIAPEYYLYSDKLSLRILAPAEIAGSLTFERPDGVEHHDEFFGDVVVYYTHLRLPLALPENTPRSFTLEVGFQGCAEAGLCYPPQLRQLEIFR